MTASPVPFRHHDDAIEFLGRVADKLPPGLRMINAIDAVVWVNDDTLQGDVVAMAIGQARGSRVQGILVRTERCLTQHKQALTNPRRPDAGKHERKIR